MTIARGRIVRDGVNASGVTVVPISSSAKMPSGRLAPAAVVQAHEKAAQILEEASARAKALVEEAELSASEAREKAAEEGRAEGAARLASAWIHFRAEEDARAERDLEKTVGLARMIAERILGEALTLDPAHLVAIARQALSQARLARRVSIVAHPEDAAILSREKAALGLEPAIVELQADPSRPRGSLRLETDLGTLDADLAPQLDRLIAALRDGLRAG